MDRMPSYANPFQGIKLSVDDREAEGRGIFEASDLKAIFSTPVYTNGSRPTGGGGEAAAWLPLIALFTGARQSELAQLRIEDLKQDSQSGLWFFDIGTEGGRSIKTASSRRKVPVHPHLVSVGLARAFSPADRQRDKRRPDLARPHILDPVEPDQLIFTISA